jgi:hypothetical protein
MFPVLMIHLMQSKTYRLVLASLQLIYKVNQILPVSRKVYILETQCNIPSYQQHNFGHMELQSMWALNNTRSANHLMASIMLIPMFSSHFNYMDTYHIFQKEYREATRLTTAVGLLLHPTLNGNRTQNIVKRLNVQ